MLPRLGLIYLVTNTVNGKRYVGQTVGQLSKRWSKHKTKANTGSSYPMHRDIRVYGAENFTVEVIAESLKPFLNDLEKFFIKLYCSHHNQHGYNQTDGGAGAADKFNKYMINSRQLTQSTVFHMSSFVT
jgi:group I intron endonuclease